MKSTRKICVLVILGLFVGSIFVGNTSANGDPADEVPTDEIVGMIEGIIEEIQTLTDTGELNERQANSMIVKLEGAVRSLNRGDNEAAVGKLNSCRRQIAGLSHGGHVSEESRELLFELVAIPCFIICQQNGPIQTVCINICCPPVV